MSIRSFSQAVGKVLDTDSTDARAWLLEKISEASDAGIEIQQLNDLAARDRPPMGRTLFIATFKEAMRDGLIHESGNVVRLTERGRAVVEGKQAHGG